MGLIAVDVIRYFISGLFGFSIFYGSEKFGGKKPYSLSLIYALVLVIFKFYIIDSPIITLFSVVVMCAFLIFRNSSKKEYRLILTHSLLIASLTECTHILIFKFISFCRNLMGVAAASAANNRDLIIFRAVIALVYALTLFSIYKLKLMDIQTITKFSKYRFLLVLFALELCAVVYLKYYIKYTLSDEFHDILSGVFVVFTIMFFVLILSAKALIEIIDSLQEKKINSAIEEAKLQKGKKWDGMIFSSEKLNLEMSHFKKELEKTGMLKQDRGSIQAAFAAVLLYHEENPQNVKLRSQIYTPISEILEINANTVESNIGNALKKHWSSPDAKILKKIKENYTGSVSDKNGAPTPKEFLLYLLKTCNL